MIFFFFNKQLLLKRDTEQKNDPVYAKIFQSYQTEQDTTKWEI